VQPNVRYQYELIIDRITEAVDFLSTIHADSDSLKSIELFTSHEGMLLAYEEAVTKKVKGNYR
jgi:3-deoxy-7-phosphoheptulonate synthase